MENLLTISIAITAAAVVLQAGILVAMYLAVRKSTGIAGFAAGPISCYKTGRRLSPSATVSLPTA